MVIWGIYELPVIAVSRFDTVLQKVHHVGYSATMRTRVLTKVHACGMNTPDVNSGFGRFSKAVTDATLW